uniref:Nibrin n=2 Tax=Anthurium amnicola TaxID=1678845 RepID=A0A1D1YAH2_9ARAE
MVWGLFPLESLPGAHKYYIFAKGTYKVGRKDCDVIIQTDRAVSRVHAEIIVDVMTPESSSCNKISVNLPGVRIRDLSKFGTFVNKELGNQAVHTFPNKEAALKNGDLVSFGTGVATFRFCFVPLVAFVDSMSSLEATPSLEATVSSIGAQITHHWSSECTHMIVDESTSVTAGLIGSVIAQKPAVRATWFMNLAEKNIRTEIPSCALHVPSLMLDGTSVKVVEPAAREKCLEGYTFVLGQSHLYKFGSTLPSLIQLVGGRILHVHEFSSSIQASADGEKNQVALIIPEGSTNEFDKFNNLASLSRVRDVQFVVSVLSGYLEPSILEPPSIHVSSSHSTDETIVAESDMEDDTAASNRFSFAKVESAIKLKDKNDFEKFEDKEVTDGSQTYLSQKTELTSSKVEDGIIINRRIKDEESETASHGSSDVMYSQALIVRDIVMPASVRSASEKKFVNFKQFRKREVVSGNSFKNLVPFSKEPYHESDYGNKEVSEYMREEKKRKQMEAIAEDLFNNEKAKKRGTAGSSIYSFLARQ